MMVTSEMTTAAAAIQPKGLDIGIYFGLPEEVYHNDPALNYSAMKLLREGYAEYWDQYLNPKRKRYHPSEEQKQGTRLHKLLLEPEKFKDDYCIVPPQKMEAGKEYIVAMDYEVIERMASVIRELPQASRYLSGGRAEVTVVWDCPETGLRCRSRHDWFRTMITTDYKSIAMIRDNVIKRHINDYGYDIQCWHYYQSRQVIKAFLKEMLNYDKETGTSTLLSDYIYASPEDMPSTEWMHNFINEPLDDFYFMFQKKTSPHTTRIIRLDDASFDRGGVAVREAKEELIYGLYTYGLDKPPACTGEVEEFSTWHGSMSNPR